MKGVFAVFVILGLACLGSLAQADVFSLGPGLTSLETVAVGDLGNAGELSGAGAEGEGPDRICGSVHYAYRVGRYEVTAAQYCDFLNRVAKTDTYGLYNAEMSTEYGCGITRIGSSGDFSYAVSGDFANRPVNYVSYWDSCRFANWLHNGQPTGLQSAVTTERGAYTLDGYSGTDGRALDRNVDWRWAIATEDEWYKAAYYKAAGLDAGYWDYPTQSNSINGDMVNYDMSVGCTTPVGAYPYTSSYGTLDQGGNVWEWTEGILYEDEQYACRSARGGSFLIYGACDFVRASVRTYYYPSYEWMDSGFRVSAVVTEPSSIVALAVGLMPIIARRMRRW